MLPAAAISLHSFSSVPLVIRRGQPKKNLWYLSEVSREAILLCELAVTVFGFFFFCLGPGTGVNYEKRVNGTRISVRNVPTRFQPTFLEFPFFPGIFHWDERTKRFPFTAKPKFPEILTKWQAPSVSTFVIPVPKLHNSERMSHESFWFSRGREETRH